MELVEENVIDIFPTRLYRFYLEKQDIASIQSDIQMNYGAIKKDFSEYATDFESPIKMLNFERVISKLEFLLRENNLSFEMTKYWTAIYNKNATHPLHNHKLNVFEKANYSGILYLSDIGCTEFFSVNPSSMFNTHIEESEIGKMVLFPSNVPHQVRSHRVDDVERFVMSFNCGIYSYE